jgi:hypothetical protein
MTDPINMLDGLWAMIRHGGLHEFSFNRKGDYAGPEVEKILRRYHIHAYGRGADDDEIWFSVKQSQAVWAEYILTGASVPLTCELLEPCHARPHKLPRAWTSGATPKGWIARLVDAMG